MLGHRSACARCEEGTHGGRGELGAFGAGTTSAAPRLESSQVVSLTCMGACYTSGRGLPIIRDARRSLVRLWVRARGGAHCPSAPVLVRHKSRSNHPREVSEVAPNAAGHMELISLSARRSGLLLISLLLCPAASDSTLLNYVTARGGKVGPVSITTVAGLRGLTTTQDLGAGDTLFIIPSSLALVSDVLLRESPTVLALAEQLDLAEHEAFAVLLLHRLRGDGVPSCVRECLPASFAPGPTWLWSEAELAELGSPTLEQMSKWRREECRRLHRDLDPLWSLHCRGSTPTYDEVEWAVAVVTSRMLSAIDASSGEIVPVLLPIADMMNHDPQASGVRFSREVGGGDSFDGGRGEGGLGGVTDDASVYVARSVGALPAHSAVTLSYDTRAPNTHLLLHFGFAIKGNPHDEAVEVEMRSFFDSVPREAVHRCVHQGLLIGRTDPETAETQARLLQPLGAPLREAVLTLVRAAAAADEMDDATDEELRRRGADAYSALLRRELRRLEEVTETAEPAAAAFESVLGSRRQLARTFRSCCRQQIGAELEQLEVCVQADL